MTRPSFSLMQSHIDLAHTYWELHLKKTLSNSPYVIVDATCGNGHDTLALAKIALIQTSGTLYCLDIQKEAIDNTMMRLRSALPEEVLQNIIPLHQSHAYFPKEIPPCDLIVYNLGYLPGGDKTKTTMSTSTLLSIQNALMLIKQGGLLSITCYPGHIEGAEEQKSLISYLSQLSSQEFLVCYHQMINRTLAPNLILVFKNQ